jgi:hypothetical protein
VRERCWLAAEATFPFSAALARPLWMRSQEKTMPTKKPLLLQFLPQRRLETNSDPQSRRPSHHELLRLTCQPSLLGKKKVAAWLEQQWEFASRTHPEKFAGVLMF